MLSTFFSFEAMYASCGSSNGLSNSHFIFFNYFLNKNNNANSNNLFTSQAVAAQLETTDLKIYKTMLFMEYPLNWWFLGKF